MNHQKIFSLLAVFLSSFPQNGSGHGYLAIPGARNSAWRLGFPNPTQYTDNELNCGGYATQWDVNGGKCGVCGDPWTANNVGEYVYPGLYAFKKIITATYTKGQEIDVDVQITANHKGNFVFRIGNIGDGPITQEKLIHTLSYSDGSTAWMIPDNYPSTFLKTLKLRLPKDLVCDHCVLQWWYTCGNNWGNKQETFVNCADVRIVDSDESDESDADKEEKSEEKTTPTPTSAPTPTVVTTKATTVSSTALTRSTSTKSLGSQVTCYSIGQQKSSKKDNWCNMYCKLGNCPVTECECNGNPVPPDGCRSKILVDPKHQWYQEFLCRYMCTYWPCPLDTCTVECKPLGKA